MEHVMKVIDSSWEIRNLGVESAVSIFAEESDVPDDLRNLIKKQKAKYQVLNIPEKRIDLDIAASEEGFYFSEIMFELSQDVFVDKEKNVPYLSKEIPYGKLKKYINVMLRDGTWGDNNRISLDPNFGKKIGSKRYEYYLQDLFRKEGTGAYGFFANRTADEPLMITILEEKGENIFSFALTWAIKKGEGIGKFIPDWQYEIVREKLKLMRVGIKNNESGKKGGCSITETGSTNKRALGMYLRNGYRIEKAMNRFTRLLK
jgi:hypothetical protein